MAFDAAGREADLITGFNELMSKSLMFAFGINVLNEIASARSKIVGQGRLVRSRHLGLRLYTQSSVWHSGLDLLGPAGRFHRPISAHVFWSTNSLAAPESAKVRSDPSVCAVKKVDIEFFASGIFRPGIQSSLCHLHCLLQNT